MYGEEMIPEYHPGDIILLKMVYEKRLVLYGQHYLVMTPEFQVLRKLRSGQDANQVKLQSENRDFNAIEVSLDDVETLYQVKGSIRKHAI